MLSLRLLDWTLLGSFLALTFLLGVFPLKDTDFWWHLKTGDLIRQTGKVPTHDIYTFTVPDHRWVDLHWGFQVALSWGYAHGGIVALNLAKCVITCLAVFLLVTARRREWPLWAILIAWLPALLVLSGRMYVRPETLSLLYLSAFLAILLRLHRKPGLVWLLPLVEVAWVNTQGLFVLGIVVLTFFLIAEVLRPGSLAPERWRWWRTILIGILCTGLACFVNPYGWVGALYPLELARTMGNPIFSESIAELTPVPEFIRRSMGWSNVPLRLQMLTMFVGALSFLVPMVWAVTVRLSSWRSSRDGVPEQATPPAKGRRGKGKTGASKKSLEANAPTEDLNEVWPRRLFRFFLFAAFSVLSLQATRNSHQFAAVVGVVTGWNCGEWAAAVRRQRATRGGQGAVTVLVPRLSALACILLVFVAVASGWFYTFTGEGRTIGLGEEPLWFPHEAVRFAGQDGMPERALTYHDGYAALYEYHNGPARKVFCDARLEVMGPEQYERYLQLQKEISNPDQASTLVRKWRDELDQMERPAVLVEHTGSAAVGSSLMASPHWRCVWFDPMAAVFVHDAYARVVQAHEVDFAARHFRPDSTESYRGIADATAMAKALWMYAMNLQERQRSVLARPILLLGLDHARRILQAQPDGPTGWKLIGQLESVRELRPQEPGQGKEKVRRYRFPFDPIHDLSSVRSTYALRRALEAAPGDFMSLLLLSGQYGQRGMDEAALPLLDQLVRHPPINRQQSIMQARAASELPQIHSSLAVPVPPTWGNLSELDRIVNLLLSTGRAGSAADVLERAYPDGSRPWEITDRIATLRIHLGEPLRARELWERGVSPPARGVRRARIAATYLAEAAFEEARRHYHQALNENPALFEAHYGLAVLEADAGRAIEARSEALAAVKTAPNDVASAAAQDIADETRRFANPDPRDRARAPD